MGVSKVTLNMSEKTLEDIHSLEEMTGNTNRTNLVNIAVRAYKRLLEMQEKEGKKLFTEDKKGNRSNIELIH